MQSKPGFRQMLELLVGSWDFYLSFGGKWLRTVLVYTDI